MALKDWKKTDTGKDEWINRNDDNFSRIRIDDLPGKKFRYEVYLIGFRRSGTLVSYKKKSQALKFAKSYMRKH